jgi:Flp pilus assembly protein TadG
VELALILPVFLMLIFGCLQLFYILFGYCNAMYASQVGVRYAIVHGVRSGSSPTASALSTKVTNSLWAAPGNSSTVTCTWSPDTTIGSSVTVKVTIIYPTMIPFSNLSTITVGASSSGTIAY